MQAPAAPSPAHKDDARGQIARLALLFICATSPRSAEFARRKLNDLFACSDIDEAELRAAQQAMLVESTQGLTALLRPAARKS